TIRWVGRYGFDLNTATTVDTQLNVFADFQPVPPDGSRDAEIIFLANIDPDIQREVLRQVNSPRLTMLDTMNYWIEAKPKELTQAMAEVDLVTMNESEIRQWAGDYSIITAAKKILNLGAKAVVVKKGEYGSFLLSRTGYFLAPAYPLEEMKDPTGAGDSFAGGFLGYLSTVPEVSPVHLRRAIIHGNVVASFAVEDFGVNRLLNLTRAEVAARYLEFRTFTQFEEP
ncbi:MAG: sugar kinase, partial [Chloroflexi bacterium]|nr:sugar kinase [Chloroflexota bacterium]